jgi:hypothetical protein
VYSSCACCGASADYPALALCRQNEIDASNRKTLAFEQSLSDDDSDFDGIDFDDGFNEFEEERRSQMAEILAKVEKAEALGYTRHLEESQVHLSKLVSSRTNVVFHIYSPTSMLCARIDLELEKLAKSFIGTIFRRIRCSNFNWQSFCRGLSLPCTGTVPSGGFLVVFKGQCLIQKLTDLSPFGNEYGVSKSSVEEYLSNCGVMCSDVPPLDQMHMQASAENDSKGSYCNKPGCTRRFPHEHILGSSKFGIE